MVSSSDRDAVVFSLSPGEAGDSPEGKKLLCEIDIDIKPNTYLLMDRAYESDDMRFLAELFGFIPVVPPKSNRRDPWEYDKVLYRQRNQIERLFRRLKRFRRIFTRYDKLDIMFNAFILFAIIFDAVLC